MLNCSVTAVQSAEATDQKQNMLQIDLYDNYVLVFAFSVRSDHSSYHYTMVFLFTAVLA